MMGKRRVVTIVLRPIGEKWRGTIKGTDTQEQVDESRERVVRTLQLLAFTQLMHAMRDPDAPLVKEGIFEIETRAPRQ